MLTRLVVAPGILLLVFAAAFERPAAQAPAAGGAVTALTGVRIIDGTGRAPIEQGTIVMANGRIVAAGAASAVQIPAGATRVDLAGKSVMPGMINAHGHVQHQTKTLPAREDLTRRLRMYANYGVTTVLSLGQTSQEETLEVMRLRDEQDGIALDRARVYTSGPSIRNQKTPDEARQTVNRYADQKVDRIKTHVGNNMSADAYGALVDQAHQRGLRVSAHIFFLKEAEMMVGHGVDVIGHSVRDQDVPASFIAEMKRKNVGYIPTLTRDLSLVIYDQTPAFFKDPFFLRGISVYGEQVEMINKAEFQEGIRKNPQTDVIRKALAQGTRNLKLLADGGVMIAMGTDSGTDEGRWQGYFEQVEIEMMAKAGMTPMQVIVASTGDAAKVAKLDHVGTIAAGKAADLVVLDANPLQDILNTRRINSVWIGGRRLGSAAPSTASAR
jgi:imidazolonepropionase-like amidohydrolase